MGLYIENLKEVIEMLNQQGNELADYIYPVLNQCKTEKEKHELCQTAKALYLLNSGIVIVKKFESPDFIIDYNGIRIGLEHETVKNLTKVNTEGSKYNLVDNALKIFNSKHPLYKHFESKFPTCPYMLVSVDFIKEFTYKQNQKKELSEQTADYIWNMSQLITSDKLDFIDHIHISPHIENSFYYRSDINQTQKLNYSRIIEAIEKKEKLVQKYREKSKTNIQWLLLTTGNLSADSFEIEELIVEKFESSFDEIYLLDDFKSKLFKIK